MKKSIKVRHAAEVWDKTGPTGKFAEILRGEIQDYGGNVLYQGSADQCAREKSSYRIPCLLIPTQWQILDAELADADHLWEIVTE